MTIDGGDDADRRHSDWGRRIREMSPHSDRAPDCLPLPLLIEAEQGAALAASEQAHLDTCLHCQRARARLASYEPSVLQAALHPVPTPLATATTATAILQGGQWVISLPQIAQGAYQVVLESGTQAARTFRVVISELGTAMDSTGVLPGLSVRGEAVPLGLEDENGGVMPRAVLEWVEADSIAETEAGVADEGGFIMISLPQSASPDAAPRLSLEPLKPDA